MVEVSLQLEPALALFYTRIALTSGTSLEQVLQEVWALDLLHS